MNLIIRPFERKDIEEVAQVHHDSYHNVSKAYRAELLQYYPLEKFQKNWSSFAENANGKKALLATDGGNIVGLIRYATGAHPDVTDWKWDDARKAEIFKQILDQGIVGQLHQFYIKPEYSRRNIGSILSVNALASMGQVNKYAMVERNKDNHVSESFQRNRLLAKDIATFQDHDLSKGEWGSPTEVFSTSVLSLLTIDQTYDFLVKYLKENAR
jgi:ribosomal protein S18 acetylase RimI-like enzyme